MIYSYELKVTDWLCTIHRLKISSQIAFIFADESTQEVIVRLTDAGSTYPEAQRIHVKKDHFKSAMVIECQQAASFFVVLYTVEEHFIPYTLYKFARSESQDSWSNRPLTTSWSSPLED